MVTAGRRFGNAYCCRGPGVRRQVASRLTSTRPQHLVMPGLGPGIHEFRWSSWEYSCNSWMPGPSPGMTNWCGAVAAVAYPVSARQGAILAEVGRLADVRRERPPPGLGR